MRGYTETDSTASSVSTITRRDDGVLKMSKFRKTLTLTLQFSLQLGESFEDHRIDAGAVVQTCELRSSLPGREIKVEDLHPLLPPV